MEDMDEIRRLSKGMQTGALCGLGQLTPGPVISALNSFTEEFEAHIKDHFCPAGICEGLFTYEIIEVDCPGCGLCIKACPQDAIAGEKKKPHVIDQGACIQCGACYQVCKLNAISIIPKTESSPQN
jgi:NAD-dependent dihydropyrimidine dehydrogenase PreA subunit